MLKDFVYAHDYPYTNFHEMNLDWILEQMIELRSDMRNFVNQNTIKYADPIQWNITTQYEANTVVIEPNSGNAYISSEPVPAGVAISNEDYWSVIGNFSVLYESIKESIAAADDGSNITATEARAEGSLLWLNSKLYKVLSDISVGALYITSGTGQNLQEVTIEELIDSIITDVDDKIEELIDSIITDVDDKIEAIDDKIEAIDDKIEAIDDKMITPLMYGAAGDGVTDDTIAIQSTFNEGGGVIDLQNKTYLIGSVNIPDNIKVQNGKLLFNAAAESLIGNDKENITFSNVTIETAYREGTDANNIITWFPFEFIDSSNIRIVDCTLICRDCRAFGFINCNNVIISACHFVNVEGTGLTTVRCRDVIISNCHFAGENQHDRSWHMLDTYGKGGYVRGIIIEGCIFDKVHGCCIQFTSTPGQYNIIGAIVRNCEMINTGECCMKVDGVQAHVSIEGCLFDTTNYFGDSTSGYAISLGGQSGTAYDVAVRNSVIRNMTGYVISFSDTSAADRFELTDCNIEGCFRLGTTHDGSVRHLTISRNHISRTKIYFVDRTGTILSGSTRTICDNYFENFNDTTQLYLNAHYVLALNNVFYGSNAQDGSGVFDIGSCRDANISNNIFYCDSGMTNKYIVKARSIGRLFCNGNIVNAADGTVQDPSNVTTLYKYTITP